MSARARARGVRRRRSQARSPSRSTWPRCSRPHLVEAEPVEAPRPPIVHLVRGADLLVDMLERGGRRRRVRPAGRRDLAGPRRAARQPDPRRSPRGTRAARCSPPPAYARATGKLGVVAVTSGPGVAQRDDRPRDRVVRRRAGAAAGRRGPAPGARQGRAAGRLGARAPDRRDGAPRHRSSPSRCRARARSRTCSAARSSPRCRGAAARS